MPSARLLYFQSVVRLLVQGLNDGLTYPQLAALLNSNNLLTAHSKPWCYISIKNTLRRIRNPLKYSSSYYVALLTLTSGEISADLARPLTHFKKAQQ